MANSLVAEALLTALGQGFQGFIQGRQQKAAQAEEAKRREEEQKRFEKQQRLVEAKFMSDVLKNVAGLDGVDQNQVLNQILEKAGLANQDRLISQTPFDPFAGGQSDPLGQARLDDLKARTELTRSRTRKEKGKGKEKSIEEMSTNELLKLLKEANLARESGDFSQDESNILFSTIKRATEALERKNLGSIGQKEAREIKQQRKALKDRLREQGINIPDDDIPLETDFSQRKKVFRFK